MKERTSLLPKHLRNVRAIPFHDKAFHVFKALVDKITIQFTNLLRQRLAHSVDWKRFACQKATVFPDELNRSLSVGLHDVSGLSDDRGSICTFKFTSAPPKKSLKKH